jgi:hypothetical protein
MKKSAECACGCGSEFPTNRMSVVHIMGKRYVVLTKHQARITKEMHLGQKLTNTVIWLASQPIAVRWKHAEAVYLAQIELRTRLEGKKAAVRAARNSWWMLVLPIWFTLGVKTFTLWLKSL